MILENAKTHQTDRPKLRSASISSGDNITGILPLTASYYTHLAYQNPIAEAALLSHDTRERYDSSDRSSEA